MEWKEVFKVKTTKLFKMTHDIHFDNFYYYYIIFQISFGNVVFSENSLKGVLECKNNHAILGYIQRIFKHFWEVYKPKNYHDVIWIFDFLNMIFLNFICGNFSNFPFFLWILFWLWTRVWPFSIMGTKRWMLNVVSAELTYNGGKLVRSPLW